MPFFKENCGSVTPLADWVEPNYRELSEVHAEILDTLCNRLWDLLYRGKPRDWTSPDQVCEAVQARLKQLNAELARKDDVIAALSAKLDGTTPEEED
jgi:hypothetical protein